jgi:hypothetical protein
VLVRVRALAPASAIDAAALQPGASFSPPPPLALESIGRFPSPFAVYDPTTPGRLHAGGELSEDGGRSWRPLVGEDGRRILPLGGSHALAPALGPDGSVLYGEVLFDEPGVPRGRGALAHGAEWRAGQWSALMRVALFDAYSSEEPVWRVVSPGYLRGQPALATETEVVLASGGSLPSPVKASAFLAASDGSAWIATREAGRFPLYGQTEQAGSWQPVAGAHPVVALAEGGRGIWAAGSHLGRREADGTWTWTSLPLTRAYGLAAHARLPLAVVWTDDRLVICRAGALPTMVPLGGIEVAWAAWDPARDDALTLVDRSGVAGRWSVPRVP